jgi:hypothetical protein
MPTAALCVLHWLDHHPETSTDSKLKALASIPAWQWATPGGHWPDLSQYCCNRKQPDTPRRPGNVLNIEVGTPAPRCLFQAPDGRGLAWMLSGGSVLAYGLCLQSNCPWAKGEIQDVFRE